MPMIEISQGNGPGLVYGINIKIPHERTFLFGSLTVGLTNKYSRFSKDKLIIFQDGQIKFRLKESNRLNWALNSVLPICVLLLCFTLFIFFPQYEALWVSLFLVFIILVVGSINRQYSIFEGEEEIGFSQERWIKPISSFSIRNNNYRIYSHSHERYSLFKDGIQIALYNRKLEKSKNRYLIYYSADEPLEVIELFCLWIDMFHYDEGRGRTILKTFNLHPDKHTEYTFWRPKDVE